MPPLSPRAATFLNRRWNKHCSVQYKKRSLSYTFTPPLLGPGACHQPFPVSLHPVTNPSLYSPHNASPPLMRSTDVLARPYTLPLASHLKAGQLFSSLTHTLTLCLLVPSPPSRNTQKHKVHSLLERWMEVVTAITGPILSFTITQAHW